MQSITNASDGTRAQAVSRHWDWPVDGPRPGDATLSWGVSKLSHKNPSPYFALNVMRVLAKPLRASSNDLPGG
jgi:hypothetical protein